MLLFHADSFFLRLLSVVSIRISQRTSFNLPWYFHGLDNSQHGGIKKNTHHCFLQVIGPLNIAQEALSGQEGT